MKRLLVEWLVCPACREGPLELTVTRSSRVRVYSSQRNAAESGDPPDDEDIVEGDLCCSRCGHFPIVDGIPRLVAGEEATLPASAHAWTTFDDARREWEVNFLDFLEPLRPGDFLGQRVLDAGCGYGRHAFFAARYGAEVVAMDLASDAVDAARRNTREMSKVHVVQGDILAPPFRDEVFDMVYSLGVIHHLQSPREAFRSMTSLLRRGGRLSVWVNGPRQGFAAAVTRGLRTVTTRLDPAPMHRVAQGIALGLRIFSHTPTHFLVDVPVARHVVTHLPVHDHHRWPFDVVVADVYDRLKVPVTFTMTGEELERWYEDDGFADVAVTRRVRNSESFRGTGVRR